ncbi:multiubiquitin domain-containing protein [Sphingopyxis sp. H115]|jgi:hypothetical protein|uniref:multiubiquitin domain-containing protein n=1 Tax=Sphingopyxis sp. H115 TaxID=1759073 RepID=UPI0007374BC9|nr:multiubiquitin domain-containing protein [Sphingopyxis sp. H115]KTE01916.1 hypothetical protein ATE71_20455 [Sphingopyxis sp. H115]MDZ4369280.1 multiubiquitin domain-containing protein [Afipia sp.]
MTNPAERRARFAIRINEASFDTEDPLPNGRDLLELAGFRPADEHLLFQQLEGGMLEDINLAEPVPLDRPGIERFFALKGDRIFFLVVDGRRFPWGKAAISEEELRGLAQVDADKEIWFDPKFGKDDLVEPGSEVSLKGDGVEHFFTADRPNEPRLVTIKLNGDPVKIPGGDYTTETLKKKLEVPADWDLDIMASDGTMRPLQPGEVIKVVKGLKFVSHVRQGGSS